MSQKVNGYLASDGKFFEHEPECKRHELTQAIRGLCDSHNINPDNFFALLREWRVQIEGYYHADQACKQPEANPVGTLDFAEPAELSQADDDHPDHGVGDKDAPGFLQLAVGRDF